MHGLGTGCTDETLHSSLCSVAILCCMPIQQCQAPFELNPACEASRLTQGLSVALPGGIPQHLNGLLPPQIEQEALVLQGHNEPLSFQLGPHLHCLTARFGSSAGALVPLVPLISPQSRSLHLIA